MVTAQSNKPTAGNTSDQDSDREPDVVPKSTADKPAARSGKRDAPKAAPVEPQGNTERSERSGRGGRRGGHFGNEEGILHIAVTATAQSLFICSANTRRFSIQRP